MPDSRLDAQHQVLVDAFAPWGFDSESAPAPKRPTTTGAPACRPTGGARRGRLAMKRRSPGVWSSPPTTIDVFFSELSNPNGLGYAQFPTSRTRVARLNVVDETGTDQQQRVFPYNGGDTATHEIGHMLGLFHTFQGGCHAESQCTLLETACERAG